MCVENPLPEPVPKTGGKNEMRGANLRAYTGDDGEPILSFDSSGPMSYSLLEAKDVPTDGVCKRVGEGY